MLFQQFLDQLTGLHLVEFLDSDAEELLGCRLHVVFVELVLFDDAEDEALLTIGAAPCVTVAILRLLWALIAISIAGMSVAVTAPVAGMAVPI